MVINWEELTVGDIIELNRKAAESQGDPTIYE